MRADFSGYATRSNLKCSDGHTIMANAFKHNDGMTVPLVWQHMHDDPANVLGHAILENRADGVYAHCFFNNSETAQNAKLLVEHKDVNKLSIYANGLVKQGMNVQHGNIREVSLVLAGANPGAYIDNVMLKHGDTYEASDEAVIYTDFELEHAEGGADEEGKTMAEVFESMSDEQKAVVYHMLGKALEESVSHSDEDGESSEDKPDEQIPESTDTGAAAEADDSNDLNHSQEGNDDMTKNVFETAAGGGQAPEKHYLSHDAMRGIAADAIKRGSAKEAVEAYALQHNITDISTLFPDATAIEQRPEFLKRRTEWVAGVMDGTRHSPFSRIKTLWADITETEARAKGYITGTLKKEEFFSVSKRVTTPTTVYKKQALDRDDVVDITDFDVILWVKAEMRMMLEEELARAILIGDGREITDEDKIKDPVGASEGAGIRSIANDHELYATTVNVNIDDANSNPSEITDAIIRARKYYKGTGTPTLYTTEEVLTDIFLQRDTLGRRLYKTVDEIAAELRVRDIVTVEVMEDEPDLIGIVVNLADYNIGADKGGEVNFFDDFDIDYNKLKYLIETRISGALIKLKSALVIRKVASTDVVTIPTQTGVVYKNADTDATLTAGAQAALDPGETLNVIAVPASGYYFLTNAEDEWSFTRPAA
jgi:hypothetical protein